MFRTGFPCNNGRGYDDNSNNGRGYDDNSNNGEYLPSEISTSDALRTAGSYW